MASATVYQTRSWKVEVDLEFLENAANRWTPQVEFTTPIGFVELWVGQSAAQYEPVQWNFEDCCEWWGDPPDEYWCVECIEGDMGPTATEEWSLYSSGYFNDADSAVPNSATRWGYTYFGGVWQRNYDYPVHTWSAQRYICCNQGYQTEGWHETLSNVTIEMTGVVPLTWTSEGYKHHTGGDCASTVACTEAYCYWPDKSVSGVPGSKLTISHPADGFLVNDGITTPTPQTIKVGSDTFTGDPEHWEALYNLNYMELNISSSAVSSYLEPTTEITTAARLSMGHQALNHATISETGSGSYGGEAWAWTATSAAAGSLSVTGSGNTVNGPPVGLYALVTEGELKASAGVSVDYMGGGGPDPLLTPDFTYSPLDAVGSDLDVGDTWSKTYQGNYRFIFGDYTDGYTYTLDDTPSADQILFTRLTNVDDVGEPYFEEIDPDDTWGDDRVAWTDVTLGGMEPNCNWDAFTLTMAQGQEHIPVFYYTSEQTGPELTRDIFQTTSGWTPTNCTLALDAEGYLEVTVTGAGASITRDLIAADEYLWLNATRFVDLDADVPDTAKMVIGAKEWTLEAIDGLQEVDLCFPTNHESLPADTQQSFVHRYMPLSRGDCQWHESDAEVFICNETLGADRTAESGTYWGVDRAASIGFSNLANGEVYTFRGINLKVKYAAKLLLTDGAGGLHNDRWTDTYNLFNMGAQGNVEGDGIYHIFKAARAGVIVVDGKLAFEILGATWHIHKTQVLVEGSPVDCCGRDVRLFPITSLTAIDYPDQSDPDEQCLYPGDYHGMLSFTFHTTAPNELASNAASTYLLNPPASGHNLLTPTSVTGQLRFDSVEWPTSIGSTLTLTGEQVFRGRTWGTVFDADNGHVGNVHVECETTSGDLPVGQSFNETKTTVATDEAGCFLSPSLNCMDSNSMTPVRHDFISVDSNTVPQESVTHASRNRDWRRVFVFGTFGEPGRGVSMDVSAIPQTYLAWQGDSGILGRKYDPMGNAGAIVNITSDTDDHHPCILVDKDGVENRLHLVFVTDTSENVSHITSLNEGATWSSEVTVATGTHPVIYKDATGVMYLLYYRDEAIYGKRDMGAGFGAEYTVIASGVADAAFDVHSLKGADNMLCLVYTNTTGDIVKLESSDNGVTFA